MRRLCDDRSVDIPRGTSALSDVGDAFLINGRSAWQYQADLYVLNYFSADEIRIISGLQVDDLLRVYNTWGPDTRNCVRFPRQPGVVLSHKLCVDVAVKSIIRQFPSSQGEFDRLQVFDVFFSVLPQAFSQAGRWTAAAEVASEHINDLILNATIKAETTEQIGFFGSLYTDPWFKSATSRILKAFVLTWLSTHPASTPIPCIAVAASAPALKIPVCPKDRAITFTGLTILEDIKKHVFPFCFLPVSDIPRR
ncbi:hypothetical protein H4582DRAFT_2070894 [Lactarius indigo]|nr:hypothetical protein H4582DRAFT_2070894 [Lactarius indigo]